MLKWLADGDPTNWNQYSSATFFVYCELQHSLLGYLSFQLLNGWYVWGSLEILCQLWTEEQTTPELKAVLHYVNEMVRNLAQANLWKARERQAKYYNKKACNRTLEVWNKVLFSPPILISWKSPVKPFHSKRKIIGHKLCHQNQGGKLKRYHINVLKY